MKATIYSPGDASVGIPSVTLKLDGLPEPDEHREEWRAEIQGCFSHILDDGRVDVLYEDECPDCLSIDGHHRGCPNARDVG